MGIVLMMDFLLGKLWGLVFHADDDRLSTRKTKIICLSLGL